MLPGRESNHIVHVPAAAQQEGVGPHVVVDEAARVVVREGHEILASPDRLGASGLDRHEAPVTDDPGGLRPGRCAWPGAVHLDPVRSVAGSMSTVTFPVRV